MTSYNQWKMYCHCYKISNSWENLLKTANRNVQSFIQIPMNGVISFREEAHTLFYNRRTAKYLIFKVGQEEVPSPIKWNIKNMQIASSHMWDLYESPHFSADSPKHPTAGEESWLWALGRSTTWSRPWRCTPVEMRYPLAPCADRGSSALLWRPKTELWMASEA